MSQRLLDPGQNPTAPCSVTVIGSEEAQNIVLVDGTSTTALGTASNPIRVNPTGTTTQPVSGTVAASQSGTWTVSIQEPLSIDDNGGSITVDGAVSVSGAVNVGNISGTINLPTGAATAALQLPDGHNVTVDNGSGINAVNIQDGGNSITVDGSVSVTGTVTANAGNNLNTSALALESGGNLATLAAKDFATQTTLSSLNSKVTACNTGAVVVSSSALPSGASTSANQSTIIGHVDGIESALTTLNAKDFATQTTLAALNTKITACDTGNVTIAALPNEGQQTMANSISVAIASNQSAVPISDNGGSITVDGTVAVSSVAGTVAISAASLPLATGAATETTLSSIDTKTPALGQTTMAGSSPVTIASDQSTINIKGAHAVSAGADNPVRVGLTDFATGLVSAPDSIEFSGITYPLILLPDPDLNFLDYTANGELRCHVFSPDNTEANARYALVNSSGHVAIDSTRQQTILFAAINASSSGDNTIVAADATRKIKVLSYAFVCSSTVNVKWKSGAGTDLSGAMPFIANTGIAPGVSSPSQGSLLETAVNQALVLNLSGAVSVAGHLSYYLEA